MKISELGITLEDLEKYTYFSKRESSRNNNIPRYKINGKVYYFKEKCKGCGEPFLCSSSNNERCSKNCGFEGKNNPFYGKKHTEETKRKIGVKISKMLKLNGHPTKDAEVRRKISESKQGKKHPFYGKRNEDSANWKGGYKQKGIPLYDTYAHQLEWAEEIRRSSNDKNVLEVRCFKCNEWYVPSWNNVSNRIQHLKGNYNNENNFYCSELCKNTCSIFHKTPEVLMKEDAIRAGRLPWIELRREVQPELRQMVLERDNNECQKCGSTDNLQCHHIYPVSTNPLESADIDNCITYCIICHKEAHRKDGCRLYQLRTEIC